MSLERRDQDDEPQPLQPFASTMFQQGVVLKTPWSQNRRGIASNLYSFLPMGNLWEIASYREEAIRIIWQHGRVDGPNKLLYLYDERLKKILSIQDFGERSDEIVVKFCEDALEYIFHSEREIHNDDIMIWFRDRWIKEKMRRISLALTMTKTIPFIKYSSTCLRFLNLTYLMTSSLSAKDLLRLVRNIPNIEVLLLTPISNENLMSFEEADQVLTVIIKSCPHLETLDFVLKGEDQDGLNRCRWQLNHSVTFFNLAIQFKVIIQLVTKKGSGRSSITHEVKLLRPFSWIKMACPASEKIQVIDSQFDLKYPLTEINANEFHVRSVMDQLAFEKETFCRYC